MEPNKIEILKREIERPQMDMPTQHDLIALDPERMAKLHNEAEAFRRSYNNYTKKQSKKGVIILVLIFAVLIARVFVIN
jgi:hypothetical protein